jgi:antitoxin (DNA-binding transcriptional repressor) of toxin-antitoxin stability system
MKTVTVRDLRNNFSKVESWLGEGEEIRIEKRGEADRLHFRNAESGWL